MYNILSRSKISFNRHINVAENNANNMRLYEATGMGSLLLTAGTKGKRYCLPHSRIMTHQPSGGVQGQASDIEIHAKEIINLVFKFIKVYFIVAIKCKNTYIVFI